MEEEYNDYTIGEFITSKITYLVSLISDETAPEMYETITSSACLLSETLKNLSEVVAEGYQFCEEDEDVEE